MEIDTLGCGFAGQLSSVDGEPLVSQDDSAILGESHSVNHSVSEVNGEVEGVGT